MADNRMISVRSERDISGHSMIPSVLGLIYILGAVGGVVFCGSVFSFTSAEFSKPSAVSMMIHCLMPCIIILLCSTSVVGWYVIPVVFFSKGFSVSSCVLFLSGREESLLRSCILTAFPAMLCRWWSWGGRRCHMPLRSDTPGTIRPLFPPVNTRAAWLLYCFLFLQVYRSPELLSRISSDITKGKESG